MRIFVYECVCAGGMGPDVSASLLCEGRAMLDAVVADFQRIPNVTPLTMLHGDDFEAIAKNMNWTLVIAPEIDGLLYERSRLVPPDRLMGSTPRVIQLTSDKLALAGYWRGRDVPHPLTDLVENGTWRRMKPPWVLKPRHGAGSQSMYLAGDANTVVRIAGAEPEAWPHGEYIVQPFVPGFAASVALLVGKQQTITLAPTAQRLTRDGRFRYLGGSLPLPAPLAQRATKLALHAIGGLEGLRGYVGVDLVLGDDGVDYAIEINPRLTTSYLGLRQLCEQNLAELMLKVVRGERVENPTWKAGEIQFSI